jgi:hypothetical protein
MAGYRTPGASPPRGQRGWARDARTADTRRLTPRGPAGLGARCPGQWTPGALPPLGAAGLGARCPDSGHQAPYPRWVPRGWARDVRTAGARRLTPAGCRGVGRGMSGQRTPGALPPLGAVTEVPKWSDDGEYPTPPCLVTGGSHVVGGLRPEVVGGLRSDVVGGRRPDVVGGRSVTRVRWAVGQTWSAGRRPDVVGGRRPDVLGGRSVTRGRWTFDQRWSAAFDQTWSVDLRCRAHARSGLAPRRHPAAILPRGARVIPLPRPEYVPVGAAARARRR